MGAVADFVNERRKKNSNLRIGSLAEISEAQEKPPITSGNVVFDYVTSIGGIPRGLVTEIRGFTGAGKTTIAAQVAAQHQQAVKRGEASGAILYLDFEYAVNEQYFKNLGIDVHDEETFVYYQPDTLEDGFNMFLDMTKADLLALCIVDSIAGASSEFEYENQIGKLSVGNKAKAIHQSLRMCVGPMRVHGTSLILINHTQVKIPQTFGEKQAASRGIQDTVSPGGKAIEYYTSMRFELSKPSLQKTEEFDDLTNEKTKQVSSTEVVATCFKNKVGTPHRTGKMRVHFGKGFSQVYSSFQILVDHGIIKKKSGGHFTFPEQLMPAEGKVPVGEAKIVEAIEEDPTWADKIIKVARELVLKVQVAQTEDDVVIEDGIDMETGEVVGTDD